MDTPASVPQSGPSPLEMSVKRQEILSTDAALTRVHGRDAEATIVNVLKTSEVDPRTVRDKLITSRAESLDVAISDLTAVADNPKASNEVIAAARERKSELSELRHLVDMIVTLANSGEAQPAPGEAPENLTTSLARRYEGDEPIESIVLTRCPGWPQEQVQADPRAMLREYVTRQAIPPLAVEASTFGLATYLSHTDLWPIAWMVMAAMGVAFVANLIIALTVCIPLALGRVSPEQKARWAAKTSLMHGKNAPNERIYKFTGDELDALHDFVPDHPVWTQKHPGVPDANGSVEPVFSACCKATVDRRHHAFTAWLTSAYPVLGTYVEAPYDVHTASPQEQESMRLIADDLLQSLRDYEAERQLAQKAIERAEALRMKTAQRPKAVSDYLTARKGSENE